MDEREREDGFRSTLFASYFDTDTHPLDRIVAGFAHTPIGIGAHTAPVTPFDAEAIYAAAAALDPWPEVNDDAAS